MDSAEPGPAAKPQIQLVDDRGCVIGVITRPVDPEALGPGREKVYLARSTPERAPHAA